MIFVSELDDDILDYAMGAYEAADLEALDEIGEANLSFIDVMHLRNVASCTKFQQENIFKPTRVKT